MKNARLYGLLLVAVALFAFYSLIPPVASAELGDPGCDYEGKNYTEGACRGGQRCMKQPDGSFKWVDDVKCQEVQPVDPPQN